jgi:hypothetical protein
MPPPGLTLSPGGVLSGTPTTIGRFHFSVQAIDTVSGAKGCPQVYTIVIDPLVPPLPPPNIPLFSPWGMGLLALCIVAVAFAVLAKRGSA